MLWGLEIIQYLEHSVHIIGILWFHWKEPQIGTRHLEGAAQAVWDSHWSLDFTECEGTLNCKGLKTGSLCTSGCWWGAYLRSSIPKVGHQPNMNKLYLFRARMQNVVFCKPDYLVSDCPLCLLPFDYPLVQGFLNWLGHRNPLWVLVLKYRFPGLSLGNSVSKDLRLGQEIYPFN